MPRQPEAAYSHLGRRNPPVARTRKVSGQAHVDDDVFELVVGDHRFHLGTERRRGDDGPERFAERRPALGILQADRRHQAFVGRVGQHAAVGRQGLTSPARRGHSFRGDRAGIGADDVRAGQERGRALTDGYPAEDDDAACGGRGEGQMQTGRAAVDRHGEPTQKGDADRRTQAEEDKLRGAVRGLGSGRGQPQHQGRRIDQRGDGEHRERRVAAAPAPGGVERPGQRQQ